MIIHNRCTEREKERRSSRVCGGASGSSAILSSLLRAASALTPWGPCNALGCQRLQLSRCTQLSRCNAESSLSNRMAVADVSQGFAHVLEMFVLLLAPPKAQHASGMTVSQRRWEFGRFQPHWMFGRRSLHESADLERLGGRDADDLGILWCLVLATSDLWTRGSALVR